MISAAEARLRSVPWEGLHGLGHALEVPLAEVLSGEAADRALTRFLRSHPLLSSRARSAVAEAVFGVGLWRRRLAAHLDDPAPTPALLLGVLVRDLGGRSDAEALLDLGYGTLPPRWARPRAFADRHSLPDWLEGEIRDAAGDEADALANALGLPGPVCFRANRLLVTRDGLAARLAREGVSTRRGLLAPCCLVATSERPNVLGLASHREGLFEVQDEGSQILGDALGARPGESVLDLCAGAGGKSLLLAAEVGRGGKVHVADPDEGKLARLRVRASRAGAEGIVLVHGAAPPESLLVDRVLVDAPCSELGALRRGPDVRWRVDPRAFAGLPALQLAILARAASHVRPGGTLVYATCTFRRAENEEVAVAFEEANREFARVAPDVAPGAIGSDGFLRTWPHRHGTDGFFAAAWVRGGRAARVGRRHPITGSTQGTDRPCPHPDG